MSKEKILESLLDKFYQGETNRQEEQMLEQLLGDSPDMGGLWAKDKSLQQLLLREPVSVPEGLEQRMSNLIDSMDASDESIKRKGFKPALRKISRWQIAAIAASLLLVLSISIQGLLVREKNSSLLVDTFDNPIEAHQATMQALELFAVNFSKGTGSVEQVDRHIEEMFGVLYQYQTFSRNETSGNTLKEKIVTNHKQ